MSRKGENIYKRKDGRWEGRYIKARTPQGKAVYGSVYASTYNEVRKKRSQAVADLVTDPSVPDIVPLQPQSFAKVSGDWLVSIQPKIKESSYMKYTNLLNSYLLPELSQILISELTSNKIQKCCDHLLTHGGAAREGLSAKTVSDILSLLRNILRFAQVQGMRPAATGREIAIRQISPDTLVLSRSSQDILCRYLYSHINERNLGILICLFTGLRIGEICALQWEDISLTEGFIYVHQTMQRLQTNGSGNTKTTVKISTPKSKCEKKNAVSVGMTPIADKYPDILKSENELRTTFLNEVVKYHIQEMMAVDVFIGFPTELVMNSDAFELSIQQLMYRSIAIEGTDRHMQIKDFMRAFYGFTSYLSTIGEYVNEKMIRVVNQQVWNEIDTYKATIEILRKSVYSYLEEIKSC